MDGHADVLVIGAGVFGLWTALECAEAGMKVVCVDRDRPGAGASGGPVGALTPYAPSRRGPLQRFQFDALAGFGDAAHRLTEATGLPSGYRRVGRVTPLIDGPARDRALADAAAARVHWRGRARFEVLDAPPPESAGFPPAQSCPCGAVRDTLSGRVTPRLYIRALARAVGRVAEIRPGWEALAIDGTAGRATFRNAVLSAGAIVVAAGWQSPGLAGTRPGAAVAGRAALLRADAPADAPVIRMRGLYIVAHPGGLIGVGSTREPGASGSGSTAEEDPDGALERVIARARRLCPGLAAAPVVERWTGVRPKPPGRNPTLGPVPGGPRLFLASGGYGVGLGIGHLAGKAVAESVCGAKPTRPIPKEFAPEASAGVRNSA